MASQLVPLSSDRHRHLRLDPAQAFHFTRGLMLCPVVSGEIREIARDYVVVFEKQGGVPQALLGTEEGVNAYVANTGHWLCRYVPAQLRRHPFYAAAAAGGEESAKQTFAIGIDESAPHLGTERGERLFGDDGTPTPTLERVRAALANLQRDFEATVNMVAQLDEAGLLVDRSLQVQGRHGKERGLTGFRVIDAEKLGGLAPEPLARLHRSGALMIAYAHLISLTNLRDGVLARPPQQATSPAADFSFGDTELLDFSRLN